ncbi:MAG: MFS transporter, partial [Egibacteraceae bacterium]
MTRLKLATADTFRSLRTRNYRLYFIGQSISVSGRWMQALAQDWLVLELTGSGAMLGLVTALQFLPILVAGPWGGVVADRIDKRRLLLVTQSLMAALAITLGVLTATGLVQLWMVFALAFAFGGLVAIDNPARQSFVLEMVGPDDLSNAVTLNSVVINGARVVGPATAGLLIATVGIAPCFLINGASYVGVLTVLALMRDRDLHPIERQAPGKGQLREGLRYVWASNDLRVPLLVMAVVGTLAYEFQVTLPLVARFVYDGGAQAYGTMSAMMGAGAVIGGLATARRSKPSTGALVRAGFVFGALILAVALAPTLPLALVGLLGLGASSIVFIATANATLQLRAAPHMRGRVMSLWGVAFLGTTPIGGPIVGWVSEAFGARTGLGLGGVATILACLAARYALRRQD